VPEPVRLIGLDPSLTRTGWGIIDVKGRDFAFVASGAVRTNPKQTMAERLGHLDCELGKVLETHGPAEAALEQIFVNRNPRSTLALGLARGAVFVSVARRQMPVHEYAPATVKQAVTGQGNASKERVAALVRALLPKATLETHDASDALAVAICHANHARSHARLVVTGGCP